MVGKVGNVDYKVEMALGMVKTFHINMLKKYYQREATDDKKQNKSTLFCVCNTRLPQLHVYWRMKVIRQIAPQ